MINISNILPIELIIFLFPQKKTRQKDQGLETFFG